MKNLNQIEAIPGVELLNDAQMKQVKGGKTNCIDDCQDCLDSRDRCYTPPYGNCYCIRVEGSGSGFGCSETDDNEPCNM